MYNNENMFMVDHLDKHHVFYLQSLSAHNNAVLAVNEGISSKLYD